MNSFQFILFTNKGKKLRARKSLRTFSSFSLRTLYVGRHGWRIESLEEGISGELGRIKEEWTFRFSGKDFEIGG